MIKKLFFLSLLFSFEAFFAQDKKPLSHGDYDLWKKIENPQISKNGNLVVTSLTTTTGHGDGYLKIYNTKTNQEFEYHNGVNAQISDDGKYVFFLQKPDYKTTRQEKKDEVKEEKQSKNVFLIYKVAENKIIDSISRVKSFKAPEDFNAWVFIEKYKDLKPEKDSTKIEKETEKDSLKIEKPAFEGAYGLVYDLQEKEADTLFNLKDFALAEKNPRLIFTKSKGEKKSDIGLFEYDFHKKQEKLIDSGRFAYRKLAIDKVGKQLAYLSAKDSTDKDSLQYELFFSKENQLKKITDTLGKNLREGWKLSEVESPYFSENGKRLFFYSRPVREYNLDTTLLEDEIPDVDVWNYQDKRIQPEQKAQLKDLKDKAYLSFFNTENEKVIELHDEKLEYVRLDENAEQRYILGYTSSPYDVSRSWEYPWQRDYYIIDTQTGEKSLALEGITGSPMLSPNGKYAIFFNAKNQNWWSLDLKNNRKTNLTKDIPTRFEDEENDVPADAREYGFGGFLDNGEVLFYDRYDIWKAQPGKTASAEKLSKDGREKNIEYRSLRLDRENRSLASTFKNDLLVHAFNKTDKTSKLVTISSRNGKIRSLIAPEGMRLSRFIKAENADRLLYRKENFRTYPDLFLWKNKRENEIKITNANPQQDEFKWGTSEPFSWTAYDGTKLDGIIYKPDNFDPDKKYPMITYFYEKRSDNLNSYYSPQPSASIVNMSYLVSNDYVVFVPDIVYKEGEPGASAYNAIVSGVEAVEKEGYIDSDNLAIQGQSWGGYQVAYLVTKTNKFKAAMAGAPVSNMTSAYGGIRWQSGLSRAFQYEKTQSRIGKNLWDGFDKYIENSPLFGIPNIETPLLMMHNDADGAVPYYQGIEMFMGMRRLNKPVWLLVYNDEAHNLRKMKNRRDLSIRMMQFFDHYLKDMPAPLWMSEGRPAVMKERDLYYDLDE